MALDDTKTLAERILRLEQKLQRLEKREGRPSVELFDNSAIRNRKIIDDLLVHNHTHANLSGLDADDHTQYLNTTRHDTTTRHTLGTVVPHDDHGSLSGLDDDDHSQYLNTTRHDVTSRHTLGTVVPHDDHGSLSGLQDDDHTQYLNTTRHDTTTRHTLGTVVPHDDHGQLTGLADDDHPQYLLRTDKAADSDKLDGVDINAFKGLNSLTDPNADRVLFWDESAGALKWLTVDGIVGTDLGKWQSHTVSWTAATTNPAIGNGTLVGRYIVIGKLCTYVLGLVMGSTTTYGSGNWAFSLPVNAVNTAGINFYGVAHLRKVGTANYERIAEIVPANSVSVINMFTDPTQGSNSTKISATVPFTWGKGDALGFEITYEVA